MPIVRSNSPTRSRSGREDSTETSDWSMNTPATTETEATTASVPASGSATSSVGRITRAAAAAATTALPPAAATSARDAASHLVVEGLRQTAATSRIVTTAPRLAPPQSAAPPPTAPAGRARPSASRTATIDVAPRAAPGDTAHASTARPSVNIKKHVMPAPEPTKTKNVGGRTVPPCASSETLMPQSKQTATRSTKSTKRKEMEARLELQRKQLIAAQNAVALAETELELTHYQSEEEFDEEFELDKSAHVENWVDRTTVYLDEPIEASKCEPSTKSDLKELAEAIITATRSSQPTQVSAKTWDLPDFGGSPEDWLPFKRAYEESQPLCTDVHNMARLRKAIKGAAKESVRSLLFVASDPEAVISALERRFGRPDQLALSELQKIKELPRVGDTPRDICVFASRISNAVTTISALNKQHYLYSPEMSKCIIDKLSPILRYRWLDFNANTREDEPELVKLKTFLDRESELCGTYAPPETMIAKKKPDKRYPVNTVNYETVAANQDTYKKFCLLCEGEHWLTECSRFKEAATDERWEIAKQKRLCFRCLRRRHLRNDCRGQPCKRCKRPHHTMLHSEPTTTTAPPQQPASSNSQETEKNEIVKTVYATADGTRVYLKMIPVDIYGPSRSARILALLDEGSTVSLLDANVAARIGATGEETPLMLETVGGKIVEKKNSLKLNLKIKGAHRRDKRTLTGVRTVEGLCLSAQHINKEEIEGCSHLKNKINELSYEREKPSLLIGQDNWHLIVSRKILKGKRNEPAASLTGLGWVLHGSCTGSAAVSVNYVNHCRDVDKEEKIENLIKQHFELDSIGIRIRRPSNDADQRALTVLDETTKQLPEGRYESGLLWKTKEETLPNNYAQAHNRLLGVEKKLNKDRALKADYENQIKKLLDSGYAERAPVSSTPGRTFYLPHFAVVHPQKKKIRIVFDAAARFEGKSLNDALLPGPDLLQSLFGVLLRFREGPVAVVADIKEMFLRISMRREDRDCLRFLWREGEGRAKPSEYRMTSVIFGAACSPATAIYVKNLHAQKYEKEQPEAARAIVRHHYMDDYLQSFETIEEAKRVATNVNRIHGAAGFELCQWASNKEEVLTDLKKEEIPTEKKLGHEEKTLGMRWSVKDDMLAFNVGLRNTPLEVSRGDRAPTKREVTSAVMSTFDPMGLAAPALIKGKKLIQDLWRTGIQWDEAITEEQREVWDQYMEDIATLQSLRIPRCLTSGSRVGEIHTFVDASESAYAAAVFWRTVTNEGEVRVRLVAGKARVAPAKTISIPRLELQAALLGARLATTVAEESDLEITSKVFWSDSTTVLQWIKADPRRFKAFVAHRLAEIEDLTKPCDWRWVPTKENPADDATRDLTRRFNDEARWFNGPAFLYRPKSEWPVKKIEKEKEEEEENLEEKRMTCAAATVITEERMIPDPARFSCWTKLLRTTARLFMFAEKCQQKKRDENVKIGKIRIYSPLEREHLSKAEKALIRQSQRESFQRDVANLSKGRTVESSSRLKNVDVKLDAENLLRLNSRTGKIENYEKNQNILVLDGKHKIAQLLIEHYHRRLHHGNHTTVVNELRQKYWIPGLRNAVRRVTRECQWCIVRRQKPETPPLGDLPRERLTYHQPAFTCTGVDYFGPMHVTIGRRHEKRWGALFTCLTTRAVHLELAASLTTSSMIMALRRMAARRGTPRIIYSDNGTNFVGANNELKQETLKIKKEELREAAEKEGIIWKFIPPGAPNMGGAWERLIRSVKTALIAVLGERSPPEEVLHTLLTEVEHTVNSRPLTHLSTDPSDEEALTPNHFLIGRSSGLAVMGQYEDSSLIGKPDWKTAQRMADHFWGRWLKEYLPTLMPRRLKGRKISEFHQGDVVIVADSSLPRNTWPRGIIETTFPGPDGKTRIVNVRTRGGVLRRPTSRLILVTATSQAEDGVPGSSCTGGETVDYVA